MKIEINNCRKIGSFLDWVDDEQDLAQSVSEK